MKKLGKYKGDFTVVKELKVLQDKMELLTEDVLDQLVNLEKLDLVGAGSEFESIPMSSHYSAMKNLKSFIAFHAYYENLDPIAKLTNLETIHICFTNLEKLPDLSALKNLENLTISHADEFCNLTGVENLTNLTHLDIGDTKVSSLAPLKNLAKLERLDIEDSPIDEDKARLLLELSQLACFTTLKRLDSDLISQDEWEVMDKNAMLENSESLRILDTSEIINRLENFDSETIESFEQICVNIQDLKTVFKGHIEERAENGGRDKIALLDTPLKENISKISEKTLTHLIEISFKSPNLSDSYELTVTILDEAIKRKSIVLQEAMSLAFIKAHDRYDAGHRFMSNSVYDTLADSHFAQFEESPLATMLLRTRSSLFLTVMNQGDELGELFYDYFTKATDKELARRVFDKYESYIYEEIRELNGDDVAADILETLESCAKESIITEQLIELSASLNIINEYLTEKNFDNLGKMLEKLENISTDILEDFEWYDVIEDISGDISKLSYNLVYSFFMKYISPELEYKNGKDLFFQLLFMIDSEKVKDDLSTGVEEAYLIEDREIFIELDVDEEAFEEFKESILKLMNP